MRRGADIRTRSKKTAMLVFINVNKESSSDVNKTHEYEYEEDDALGRRLVKGEEKTSCMRPDEVVTACVQPSNHPLYHTMTTTTTTTSTSTACATLRYLSRSVVAYQLFVRPFGPVKYPL